LKISNSLGIVNFDTLYDESLPKQLKTKVVDSIEGKLTRLWRGLLKSNIEKAELIDYDLNFVTINKTSDPAFLILSYTLKLDTRIADDEATIMKISQIINSSLLTPNSLIYRNLTSDFNSAISFVLSNFKLTRNSFLLRLILMQYF